MRRATLSLLITISTCVLISGASMWFGAIHGEVKTMAVWSDLLYMVGQEHQEEIRGLRRQFTWSVADVQNGMLVLRCGTHQIYFLFSGHDLSADALSKLKSDEFSTGWLVIPRTVEHRGTDTVVTGRALIAGEDIAGRLMTLGVLLDSKTAADDNPGKDAE